MIKKVLAVVAVLLTLVLAGGCARGPGATATMKDYTGNSPNGSIGTVLYIAERPNYKGLEVTLEISGFGELPGVKDQSKVDQVTKALAAFASLENLPAGYQDVQYYYVYYSDVFKEKSYCKLRLFYLVPPEAANANLRFVYKNDDAKIDYSASANVW